MEKPSLPKGTRDFGPAQMAKRQFIFDRIKKVFQKYGFLPLETPAMENLSTLTGKYGDEGDQLLFKILNSGDYTDSLKSQLSNFISQKIKQDLRVSYDKVLDKLKSIPKTDLSPREIVEKYDSCIDEYFKSDAVFGNEVLRKFLIASSDAIVLDNNWNPENQFEHFYTISSDKLLNEAISPKEVTKNISEKGLRYDLTVPFARYVVMNRHEITFPFKRYQIQPVWRGDRPQKGRYREFYQCDADVVGTDSLICEAEIILMIKEVFKALGIGDYTIKINHRGVLRGLAELAGSIEKQSSLFVAIDKLDKVGEEQVKEELVSRGFTSESIQKVFDILNFKGSNEGKLNLISTKNASSENSNKGIKDLKEVFSLLGAYGETLDHVEFDIALARGLSYYTGCIFEVKINNVAIGSVSGGGRYDNLTGVFDSKDKNSGVGISFGVDRIYDAMEGLKLFPTETQISSKVLICHFDEECKRFGLKILNSLRQEGIASEIYPDGVKIQKQLDFANKKMIPYTIVIGSDEMKSGVLAFKDMKQGEQQKLSIEEIVKVLN